jgi:hypothetical protein
MAALRDGFAPAIAQEKTELPTYTVPESIDLFKYPRVIRDFEKHLRKLQRRLAEDERMRDAHRDLLHSTEWHAGGTNDKQRDSRFKVLLQTDRVFQGLEEGIIELYWHIKDEEAEYNKLISESVNARLRYRNNLVAAELFAGVPVNPFEDE